MLTLALFAILIVFGIGGTIAQLKDNSYPRAVAGMKLAEIIIFGGIRSLLVVMFLTPSYNPPAVHMATTIIAGLLCLAHVMAYRRYRHRDWQPTIVNELTTKQCADRIGTTRQTA